MKYKKNIIPVAFLAISITSFTSCDKISGIFDRSTPTENTTEAEYANTESKKGATESLSKAKEDSLAQVRKASLAHVEAAQQAKEIVDKLSSQSDSINGLNSKFSDLEKKSVNLMDKSSAYTFMVVEFILFLLILWYLYVKLSNRIKKLKSRLHNIEKSDGGISEIQVNRKIQTSINDLVKQINNKNKSQDDRMDDIVKRLIKLEGPNDAYSQYAQTSFQQPQPEAPKKEDPKKSNTFYMPRTRMDLQFDDSKKKYVKDETTYFKFVVKKGNKAEFTFDPQENNIVGAYDDRENSLVTVCDVESKSPTPSRYNNITPGEAELRNGTWHVTRKLKLEYV